jgi:C4-dicarboxylate transporter DctM subunit
MTPGVELVFVLIVFVSLLCVGMTIPFAILVPSVRDWRGSRVSVS